MIGKFIEKSLLSRRVSKDEWIIYYGRSFFRTGVGRRLGSFILNSNYFSKNVLARGWTNHNVSNIFVKIRILRTRVFI